ncbi:phosphoenolpyruvate--protein phosphotransferase [Dongshaea marina]|uniref:phosphoenolpyruvate--protein phosphotransferase n=1 Tax=Dongshaea marina TaxID=2047966 RepID=UPI000D3E6B40|nr:phosphoenolpyruvate--protein phosphotransferase [Dongshaea marina]
MLTQLREIVEQVSAAAELQSALDILVNKTRAVMGADCCSIFIVQSQQLSLMAACGPCADAIGELSLPLGEGVQWQVALREEPINLADIHQHPRFIDLPGLCDTQLHGFLGVPIIHQRQVLGVLVVQQQQKRFFDESEESFLVTLAAQIAVVIAHDEAKGKLQTGLHLGICQHFQGLASAPGIGIAKALIWNPHVELEQVGIHKAEYPARQLVRLDLAIEQVFDELDRVSLCLKETLSGDTLAIFDIYRHLLKDPLYLQGIRDEIGQRSHTAATAVKLVSERMVAQFSQMRDPYFQERSSDIRDVARRLLSRLVQNEVDQQEFPDEFILIAEEISAATLAELPRDKLRGIVSAHGSHHSHAAILAKALGVPAVMGLNLPLDELNHSSLIIDGYSGDLFVNPDSSTMQRYREYQAQESSLIDDVMHHEQGPAALEDGVEISLLLNIGLGEEQIHDGLHFDGVGLYRSEYPFMLQDSFPSELEQQASYRAILKHFRDKPVCMRILDVGGDKLLPYFPVVEPNPFLGWRGIRLMLDHPEIFLQQLKAMLRADQGLGNLSIMLPMVTTLHEIFESRRLLEQAWKELKEEKEGAGEEITALPRLGVMLEVPSLLYLFDELAGKVDFISIGTNDLTQYLLAVDRNNTRVSPLYDVLHPALLRALEPLPVLAREHGKPLSVCGELAGDPIGALVLVAMGYRQLSMNRMNLSRIKYILRRVRLDELQPLLKQGMAEESSELLRKSFTDYLEFKKLGGFLRAGA